jgi:hypothetical protein
MHRTFAIVLLLSPIVQSQVRVSTLGAEFNSHDQINVQISNAAKGTVSYCVEFGQHSFKAASGTVEDMETTPIPFYVQRQNGRKWATLLIGPDIGSSRHAVVLKPGQSQHYPFRLSDRGRMRLILDYWDGENEKACEYPKGTKTTRSNAFVVN